MRTLALVIGMLATPAVAADQFDLVCKTDGSTVRYRVDTVRGEACSDTCDRIWKMGPTTAGEYKLIDRVPVYRGDLEERATVNRATGVYQSITVANGKTYDEKGSCEPASFSGFPAAKF